MPKSEKSRRKNLKLNIMYIKLKNKSEICVNSYTFPVETTCYWCGKTIKSNKPHFAGGGISYACSVAHVKAAANAAL
jgi:hypothetical protein